jgi:hypothetical protein
MVVNGYRYYCIVSHILFFGWQTYLTIALAFYNIGVNSQGFFGGAYTKTPIDLGSGKVLWRQKKSNFKTMIISIPQWAYQYSYIG